jgi:hypothetical protein
VARDAGGAERLLDDAERWLNGQDWIVTSAERDLVTLE